MTFYDIFNKLSVTTIILTEVLFTATQFLWTQKCSLQTYPLFVWLRCEKGKTKKTKTTTRNSKFVSGYIIKKSFQEWCIVHHVGQCPLFGASPEHRRCQGLGLTIRGFNCKKTGGSFVSGLVIGCHQKEREIHNSEITYT